MLLLVANVKAELDSGGHKLLFDLVIECNWWVGGRIGRTIQKVVRF